MQIDHHEVRHGIRTSRQVWSRFAFKLVALTAIRLAEETV